MCLSIKSVLKKIANKLTAEFTRWQANAMNNYHAQLFARRSLIMIGRNLKIHLFYQAGLNIDIHDADFIILPLSEHRPQYQPWHGHGHQSIVRPLRGDWH
jgi:hypothetical protein